MLKIFLVRTPAYNEARGHTWVYYTDTPLSVLHPPPPNNKSRLSLPNLVSSAMTKMAKAKEAIQRAPPGVGIKGRLQVILQKLEEWIHPNEGILHSINNSPSIQVLSTTTKILESDKALARRSRRLMHVLMSSSAAFHKKWAIMNGLALPVSAAASLLPGPNVFLVWNVYRLYCHIQAYKGANSFIEKQRENMVTYGIFMEKISDMNKIKDSSGNEEGGTCDGNLDSHSNNNRTVESETIQFNHLAFQEHLRKVARHHRNYKKKVSHH